MREVEQGNLQVSFPTHRNDEMGYLGTSFNGLVTRVNEMLQENTQLVKQVYETDLLQKEAQVQALHNQIRPHFLFNTLNMISMQMQTGKQDKAIDHLHKLSSMLRSMTRMDKDIPLEKELDLLKAYLSIQSSRYEGRLEYGLKIDPDLYGMPIPALLFQPVVENAVIHGCEAKREKTSILISGEKTARGEVLFTIRDSGQGMSPETLQKLRGKLEQVHSEHPSAGDPDADGIRAGTGIGLLNVNKRIKLKYGSGYGIKVDSMQGQGTAVYVLYPKLDSEGATWMYKVLIVDDEPLVREYLRLHIASNHPDWEVAGEAMDGQEAWEMLQNMRVHLVITDIKMPVVDGLELCRRLSQSENPPIILILSGFDEFSLAREALRFGVQNYLLKPVVHDELALALTQVTTQLDRKFHDELAALAMGKVSKESQTQVVRQFLKALVSENSVEIKALYPLVFRLKVQLIETEGLIMVLDLDEDRLAQKGYLTATFPSSALFSIR